MAEARKSARASSSTNGYGDRRQDKGRRHSDKREETTEGEGHLAPERGAWPGASPPGRSRAGEERAHLTRRLRAEKQERTRKKQERGRQESKPGRRQTQSTETAQKGRMPRRRRASQMGGACDAQPSKREAAGTRRRTARGKAEGERQRPRQRGRSGGAAEGRARSREEEEKRASRLARDGQRRRRFRAALRTGRSQKPGHAGPPRQAGQIVKNAKSGRPPESGGRRRDRRRGPGVRQGAGSTL